jgi:hypothetical protein
MMVLIGDYTAVIDGRRFDDIRTYTLGIMFFGTPHRGSESTAFPMTLGNVLPYLEHHGILARSERILLICLKRILIFLKEYRPISETS